MAALSLETVVARRGEPLAARVDDDLVMLDPVRSRYFALDATGRRVWELLGEPRSVESLCAALQDEFEVSAQTCRTDVVTFLQQMADAGLVETR
jgi:hypothetical protein